MNDLASDPVRIRATSTNSTPSADDTSHGTSADLVYEVWVGRRATLLPAAYRFYRALLLVFPERGGPPDGTTLRRLARRFGVELEATLARLATEDLVQRDPATGAIRAAYPFSGVPTAHHVTHFADLDDRGEVPEVQVYAMCALDALGIPLMLRRDALITSADALTGEEVHVLVRQSDEGTAGTVGNAGELAGWATTWEPSTTVVYARPEEYATHDRVAAGYRCPVTNFFATAEHAHAWRTRHGSPEDVILTHAEALQRAHRRFAGVLDHPIGEHEAPEEPA
jgi:hypothetical protein